MIDRRYHRRQLWEAWAESRDIFTDQGSNRESAQEFLEWYGRKYPDTRITLDDILSAVCYDFNVTEEAMKSLERTGDLSMARKFYMLAARRLTTEGVKSIAHRIRRDHTSLIAATSTKKEYPRSLPNKMMYDGMLKRRFDNVISKLKSLTGPDKF